MRPRDLAPGARTPDTPTPGPPGVGAGARPAGARPAGAGAAPGARTLAHAGVTWTVTECDGDRVPGNADGARGRRCLTFASPEVIRRVWDVPADWRALPDAELFALSWRR